MSKLIISFRSLVLFILFLTFISAAQDKDTVSVPSYKHSIDLTPMSVLFRIYAIHYCYRVTQNSEIIIGPYYANIKYDMGNTNAPGFIVGYRQYIWRNLHIDYQLIPQWDRFYDKVEDKSYPLALDLWNEFRLGYTWDFSLFNLPAFINVQWPFGFALYSDPKGKSQAFKDETGDEPFFYFPPMFFIGVRF